MANLRGFSLGNRPSSWERPRPAQWRYSSRGRGVLVAVVGNGPLWQWLLP